MENIMRPATWAALIGSASVATFAQTWLLKAPALAVLVAIVTLIVKRAREQEQA